MKRILAGHLNPRASHDGWALIPKGDTVPDLATFSTTREEVRQIREAQRDLFNAARVVKVRVALNVAGWS